MAKSKASNSTKFNEKFKAEKRLGFLLINFSKNKARRKYSIVYFTENVFEICDQFINQLDETETLQYVKTWYSWVVYFH